MLLMIILATSVVLLFRAFSESHISREINWISQLNVENKVNVQLTVRVTTVKQTSYGISVIAEILTDLNGAQSVLIYPKETVLVYPGDVFETTGCLNAFDPAKNPGQWDGASYYTSVGIIGNMNEPEFKLVQRPTYSFVRWLYMVKKALTQHLNQVNTKVLGLDFSSEYGLLCAMLLGDQTQLPEPVRTLFSMTGIIHLCSISGLHISFLGWLVFKGAFRIIGKYTPSAILAVLFMTVYFMFCGSPLSAMRALLMFAYRLGAHCLGRIADGPISLSIAAFGVILWQPYAPTGMSFQFSFLSVGLLMLIGVFITWIRKHEVEGILEQHPLDGKLFYLLATPFLFYLGLLPLNLYYNYYTCPYTLLLNLAVIPLSSLVMAGGALGIIIVFFSLKLGGILLFPVFILLRIICWLAKLVLYLPFSFVVSGEVSLWQMGLYGVLLAGILWVWCRLHKREFQMGRRHALWRQKAGCVVAMGVLGVVLMTVPKLLQGRSSLVMLNVGQGDCFVVRSEGGFTGMVDGGSSDQTDIGSKIIEPYLLSQGIDRISVAALSHLDNDHISGIVELLELQAALPRAPIQLQRIVVSDYPDEKLQNLRELARAAGVEIVQIQAGQQLEVADVTIRCLHPAPEYLTTATDKNVASLVLLMEVGQEQLLFTGDIDAEAEKAVLEYADKKNIALEGCILKAAHHGSRYSSSETFIQKVSPKLVLISSGEDNAYGHPHAETLERFARAGVKVWQTREEGYAEVRLD